MQEIQTEIFNKIKNIFLETFHFSDEGITRDTKMDDIPQWSSLTHIYIIDKIESVFDITFSAKEIEKSISITVILQLIEEKLNK